MGVYNFISGAQVIGKIDHDLTLDNSDWIAKAPLWIIDCICDLGITLAYEDVRAEVEIIDYQCAIPLNIKLLETITVNNIPLTPHKALNQKFTTDTALINHATKYSVLNNTYITFGVETGTAIFYYKIPAVEVVDEYGIVMPKVVDEYYTLEAIKWFIMVKLLQNGYIHPVFNLTQNNPFTNAGMLYNEMKKKARNSLGTMDQAEWRNFAELSREFIKNYDYFYNERFSPVNNG